MIGAYRFPVIDTTPLGLDAWLFMIPRVEALPQPWAIRRCPVGAFEPARWDFINAQFPVSCFFTKHHTTRNGIHVGIEPTPVFPFRVFHKRHHAESQRDSISQPRVAASPLPWVNAPRIINPNGVASFPQIPFPGLKIKPSAYTMFLPCRTPFMSTTTSCKGWRRTRWGRTSSAARSTSPAVTSALPL